MDMWCTSIF
jgi:hypothetical protein